MPTTQSPSLVQLKRALAISEEIQQLEAELAAVLGGGATITSNKAAAPAAAAAASIKGKRGPKKGGKRFVSPEARAKMAAAQRARWAKSNGSKAAKAAPAAKSAVAKAPKAAKGPKAKKATGSAKFTAEWRAKLAEAARQRWARKRAGK